MTNKFEQLKNEAQNIRMTESEKSLQRARITETMEHFPIRETAPTAGPVKSPFRFMMLARSMAFVLVGFIAGGGGLAFAAESSLPGDILYPVKTEVTEEFVAVFKPSPEAKIAYEQVRIKKRAGELLKLQQKGKLVESRARIATDKIEASQEEMKTQVVRLSKDLSFNGVQFSAVDTSVAVATPQIIDTEVSSIEEVAFDNKPKQRKPIMERATLSIDSNVSADISTAETDTRPILTPADFTQETLKKIQFEVDRLTKDGTLDEQGIRMISVLMTKAEEAANKNDTKSFFHLIREIKSILEKHIRIGLSI